MKKCTLLLLLSTAPLFAGVSAPAPCSDCEEGVTFGLEALYMRAYQSDGHYDSGDWDFGGRASLGYQFNDCLFTKVTYFGYKSDVYEYSDPDNFYDADDDQYSYEEDADIEVSYLGWVVGQHFKPSEKFTFSPYVGLRWGTFDENYNESENDDDYVYNDRNSSEFSGLGIVIGVDGTRSIGNGFSIYGTAKTSVLFGTTDYRESTKYSGFNDPDDNFSDSDSEDNIAFVSELGLGAQYDFAISNVAASIRLGAEAQWWAGQSGRAYESNVNGTGFEKNAGLIGFVLGANFRF